MAEEKSDLKAWLANLPLGIREAAGLDWRRTLQKNAKQEGGEVPKVKLPAFGLDTTDGQGD